jgi:la-related protein 1
LHPLAQELQGSRPKRSSKENNFQERKQGSMDTTTTNGLDIANSRAVVGSLGSSVGSAGSGSESHALVRPPRAHHKLGHNDNIKRLFASAPRDVVHRGRQNQFSITAESPPSDSVGFFFGSTPPDNQRFVKTNRTAVLFAAST